MGGLPEARLFNKGEQEVFMNLNQFVTTLFKRIGETGAKYDFVAELFKSASEEILHLEADMVRGWFRVKNPTKSYLKLLKGKFNEAKFNVFIKSRTEIIWKDLMNDFIQLSHETESSVIKFKSKNHDEFIERLERQFKAILRIPTITTYEPDYITIRNIEGVEFEFSPNIEKSRAIHIREKWVVATDLSIEQLLANRYIDAMYRNLGKGMKLVYFVFDNGKENTPQYTVNIPEKYLTNMEIVHLTKNPGDLNYFSAPELGYIFYFIDESGGMTVYGYEFHRFYGMEKYREFRMHEADADKKISELKRIRCIDIG